MLSGNSLRQTAHTHCASVHQAVKLTAALLRVAGVTAGLAESNGSLPSGLWVTSPAGWLPRTGIRSGSLCSVIEYGLSYLKHCSHKIILFFAGKCKCSIAVNNYHHLYGNSHAIWDHSVTCHPAEVEFLPLPQPKLVLDLATPEECKAELT